MQKEGILANLVVVEKGDVNFLLELFGKYSVSGHDGEIETLSIQPDASTIK